MKRSALIGTLFFLGCITKGDFSADSLMTDIEFALPGSRVGRIGPGVVKGDWSDPQRRSLHVIAIDTSRQGVVLRAAIAHDRIRGKMEPLDALAKRKNAVVALSIGYPDKPGYVTGGLTVIDRAIQFAPNPPQRPSLVISRDYSFRIGKFHPDLNPELDFDEALTGLWSVGAAHETAPVLDRPWTMVCRMPSRGALLFIYAPDGGPAEPVSQRFKCSESFIAAIGARAGMVLNGKNVARASGLRRKVGSTGSALLLHFSK